MTIPKMKPCPKCHSAEHVGLTIYEHGWKHVECYACNVMGAGEGSKLAAVRAWNAWALIKQPANPLSVRSA